MKLPRLRIRPLKSGGLAYYFDRGGKPRRWELLGYDERVAMARYRRLTERPGGDTGTVDQMLGEAIAALNGKVKPGTLANYRSYRKHLSAVWGYCQADDLEEMNQAAVMRYLRECPRMTFRSEIAFLSLAYQRWMEQERLTFNPCFGVKVKRKGSRRTRLLTWHEVDLIVGKADERLAVAIELACALGLRISDCCALTWRAVDEYLDTQKTGRRLAWQDSEVLTAILARARALQAVLASPFVLCDRRGQRWKTGTLRDHWKAASEAAGVADARFHDLRAAAATEVEKRHGRKAAQEFLGHKHELTTELYLRDKRVTVVRPLERKRSA